MHDSETLVDGNRTVGDGQPAAPRVLSQGDRLGRYVLLDELGRGGMGVVFAAYDPELDRRVAVKLLHARAGDGSVGQRRLLREAQAMARLSHPNVVVVHDVGVREGSGGDVYVAMEFIAGRTLRKWLDQRRTRKEILAVMLAAGRGLSAAHEKGLVHRDFKPDNVMIADEDGRVRVMDFGLARAADANAVVLEAIAAIGTESNPGPGGSLSHDITREGAVVGTPAYMAPEQLRGRDVDARADQFAFCVVLYEALYGERPFAGDSLPSLAANLSSGEIRPPPTGSAVPAWLRRILVRGLDRDPDQRWPSMRALMTALRRDPTRMRRRWATGIAGVALIGGMYGAAELEHLQQVRGCTTAANAIDETWNDGTRADLTMGLAMTESPIAGAVAERTAARLDEYAAAWREVRGRACTEEHVDGLRTAQSHVVVARCLDDDRAAVGQLVELLGHADLPIVARSISLVTSLPPPSHCLDRSPDDPDAQIDPPAEIQRARTRASLMLTAGRYADARQAAQEALDAATAAGLEGPRIEAERVLGSALFKLGKVDAGAEHLQTAFFDAERLGRDDLAAEAASSLASTAPSRTGRVAEGLIWAKLAEAAYDRISEGDTIRRGELLNNLGNVQDALGQSDAALQSHLRGLAMFRAALGDDHPRIAASLNNLGNVYLRRGEYAMAEDNYRQALQLVKTHLGDRHPEVATNLDNLGNARLLQDDVDGAIELKRQALRLRREVLPAEHPKVGLSAYNLGTALYEAGQLDEARERFADALSIYEAAYGPEHREVADALGGLAVVALAQGDIETAVRHQQRSMRVLERTREGSPKVLITPLANLASVERAAGDLDAALASITRAEEIARQELTARDPKWFNVYALQAEIAQAREDPDRALTYWRRAYDLVDTADARVGVGTRIELARTILATGGDRDEARALLEAARETLGGFDGPEAADRLAQAEALLAELNPPAAPDR